MNPALGVFVAGLAGFVILVVLVVAMPAYLPRRLKLCNNKPVITFSIPNTMMLYYHKVMYVGITQTHLY